MRFYDVNGGSIEVAGNDIRSLTRASLRGSYGMVLQETWLRAGTVRENIAYGKPDATEEEIVAAAKAAHADSFIRRLPKGYDTVIAEDGGNISQGQKQLLCIARVMLCLPPMLILDEATSSIDTRTEVRIQAAFARMMQGRTSFIVAHRLSTIREADVILVMKDGHIVEQGDHDDPAGAGRLLRQALQQPVRGRGDLKFETKMGESAIRHLPFLMRWFPEPVPPAAAEGGVGFHELCRPLPGDALPHLAEIVGREGALTLPVCQCGLHLGIGGPEVFPLGHHQKAQTAPQLPLCLCVEPCRNSPQSGPAP